MIQVVNRHKHKPTPNDIYIGRGTPLGNPWSWHPAVEPKFRVADRAAAIFKYSQYAEWARLNRPEFANFFNVLFNRVLNGETIYLVCSYKPKGCHVDVIKRMIEERIVNFQENVQK